MARERPLTTGDIARMLHVTPMAVLKWIKAGKLKAYRVRGGHHRIERDEFQRFLQENEIPIPEELRASEPRRILVVDNDPSIREALQLCLSQRGYQVSPAPAGRAALKAVKQQSYDLVFLDVLLPGKSGPEVFQAIQALEPSLMVVLLTESPDHPQVLEALELGPAMLLCKPFGAQQIESVLDLVFKDSR